MEEICRPLSVPSVIDVLTAEKIVEIEQSTVDSRWDIQRIRCGMRSVKEGFQFL